MTRAAIFPATMILLSLAASVAYAAEGDGRRVVYWLSAAVLTASVTV